MAHTKGGGKAVAFLETLIGAKIISDRMFLVGNRRWTDGI